MNVADDGRKVFEAWLRGELLLIGLLGAWLAFFVAYPELRASHSLPELGLVLQTVVAVAATIVAVLAGLRFSVERRWFDLLLATGFAVVALSTLAFSIAAALGEHEVGRAEAWAGVAGGLLAWVLIAAAPFARGRLAKPQRALGYAVGGAMLAVVAVWLGIRSAGDSLPELVPVGSDQPPFLLTLSFGAQALLNLVALIGFGLRFRRATQDLDRWLALAATLMLFSSLHYVLTPLLSDDQVSHSDFLRILGYGVLLVGVWQAIRESEFGRAVAEERARVAREIHDGLAQYLFAISTHASMLEAGAPLAETVPRLKQAAASAQQEARFAVLALSSASGTAPFDAALRRYVEFLTADGELDVELEIDTSVQLAPDEQIEVFRIVQEGLANVRKHAGARHADVTIGHRDGQRFVTIQDDGAGFESEPEGAGQGLRNIRDRAASVGGGFRLRTRPGYGTALEITLRA
jgi:two-component system, NarL family, sensor histidine kinase DegS